MPDDRNGGSLSPEGQIAFDKMQDAHAASAEHLTTLQILLDHKENVCHGFSDGHISNILAGLELFILGHMDYVPPGIRSDWYHLLQCIAKLREEFSYEDIRATEDVQAEALVHEHPPKYFESAVDREDDF